MELVNDINNKVKDYLDGDYEIQEVKTIPKVDNVAFGKKAKKLDVCAFNIDLRKSSELLEVHQKQTSGKIHKAFLTATSMVVNHYGGEIRSFNGDGLLAFWTANTQEEITNVCKTAMILTWFLDHKVTPHFKKYTELDFGIGIDWGTVYVLRAGIPREVNNNDLIFIGKCVNFAVAMSKTAEDPNHVEISTSTYENLLEDRKYKPRNGQKVNMWTDSKTEWNEKIHSTKKTNWYTPLG